MTINRWLKHGLTTLSLLALFAGLIQLIRLNAASDAFGDNMLSGTFFVLLFAVLIVYRISWIGASRINWLFLVMALFLTISLVVMLLAPKNILALWKPTIALFTLFSGTIFYSKIDWNNWAATATKILLLLTCGLFLFPLLINVNEALYFSLAGNSLFATIAMAILSVILRK